MNLRRREFLGLAPLLFLHTPRPSTTVKVAPGDGDEAILSAIRPIRETEKAPGLIAGFLVPGRAPRIAAVGLRKLGSSEGFGAGDVVHIGSCTKAMTATMIATLVEQGALAWTSTLGEILHDPKMHAGVRPITLEQLLTHRSGLPANTDWWSLVKGGMSTTEGRRALLERIAPRPPATTPGTTFTYSNVGYALAGLMAETVTKRAWEDLMRERVFVPLKMTSAGFGSPGTTGTIEQPWGHRASGEPVQFDNAPVLGPAGTMHMTMADWMKFVEIHVLAARQEPAPLLKPETFRALQTPPEGRDYAKGWVVAERPWAGGSVLNHSGSNTVWYCTVWVAPKKDCALFSATNIAGTAGPKATDRAVAAMIPMAVKDGA